MDWVAELDLPNPKEIWSTLPETSRSHLKMDGWNTSFRLGSPIFRGYVSFREGKYMKPPNIYSTSFCVIFCSHLETETILDKN